MQTNNHLVLGHGGAGKDTACKLIAKLTGLRLAPSTSQIISEEKALEKGVPWQHIYNSRRENREQMRDWGTSLCVKNGDYSYLLRRALERGNVANGCRRKREFTKAAAEMLDCVWWVHADVPEDVSLDYDVNFVVDFAEKHKLDFHVVVNTMDGVPILEQKISRLLESVYVE